MENLNKGFVFVAVFLAAASLCDAGEKGRWDPRSAAEMHLYHADIQESVTKNVTTTTMASTETTTANPPPPSSSGYSLTYTHSTENGTVVVANDNDDNSDSRNNNDKNNNNSSTTARSRKKGDLEEPPIEELPSLPDPPLHSYEADTSTTRTVVPKKGLDSPASLEADAASEQHHHAGRIVGKKGVEAGDEDDGGIRNEMATTSEAPSFTDHQYNTTGSGDDDNSGGGLNTVVVVPEHVESPSPAAENVPHVAEVPEPRHIPILNDRGRGQQQESKSDADPSTPDTSLVVGLIFAATLFSVLAFLVFKRVRSAQRRREYRRMNDFLIDGMYNDL